MNEEHFRKLEQMYHQAPINHYFQPTMVVKKGEAEVTIPVKPDFFHAAKAVHGAIYFKAMDDAAYFAVNSLVEDFFIVTTTFNVHFLKPISEGVILAKGRVTHQSKSSFIAEATLFNSAGEQIALGTGAFVRSKIPLSSLETYPR